MLSVLISHFEEENMFRAIMVWRENEAKLRLLLLMLGIAALIVETDFPTKGMLAWRGAFYPQSFLSQLALLLFGVCGSVLAGFLFHKKWQWGMECTLTILFFIMSLPFAPLYWSIVQSIALGVGLGVTYRFKM